MSQGSDLPYDPKKDRTRNLFAPGPREGLSPALNSVETPVGAEPDTDHSRPAFWHSHEPGEPLPETDERPVPEPDDSFGTPTPVGQFAPGQIIFGRYRVERKLGEGGMGTVWLIRHLVLDVPRALKLIHQGYSSDPKSQARFKREARVMACITHPCSVSVHDAHFQGGFAFIEMEYVEGVSLNRMLTPGAPMPLDWTTRILKQLCDVLQLTHDLGIVHRDLKPSNLMLVDGRPPCAEHLKVLDFGIAKILESDSQGSGDDETNITCGEFAPFTPKYTSPEQVNKERVDRRSDLYSVGVMLYEFLTGHTPFSGPRVLFDHLMTAAPPFAEKNPNVQVPPGVERVVLRCLAKNPEERPQSARELLHEFLAALPDSAPSEAPSPGLTDSLPTTGRDSVSPQDVPVSRSFRFRGGVWMLVAVAGLGGAGLATFLALGSTPVVAPGFVPAAGEVWSDGGPRALIRRDDGARFSRSPDGLYLPEGYESAARGPSVNGWPRTLRRARDGALHHLYREGIYLPDGYEVEPGHDPAPGQPPVIVRRGDGRRFVWTNAAFYLPEGHEVESDGAPRPGRPPAAIVRHDGGRFLWIEGDTFEMGAMGKPTGRPEDDDDQPPHPTRVSGFYLQETEVTNLEMESYFKDNRLDPADEAPIYAQARESLSQVKKLDESVRHPAVGVSHRLAQQFAAWASGRLPTEAEWEFAARSRGRNDRPFVWGENEPSPSELSLGKVNVGWRGKDFPTKPVKQSPMDRTDLGVFDMAGNVREWCLDVWGRYPSLSAGALVDDHGPGSGPRQGTEHVLRGGSFNTDADRAMTTRPRRLRESETGPDGSKVEAARDIGFRVVIEPVRVPGSPW